MNYKVYTNEMKPQWQFDFISDNDFKIGERLKFNDTGWDIINKIYDLDCDIPTVILIANKITYWSRR